MENSELRKHKVYHEAGHFVLSHKLGIPLRRYGESPIVTIKKCHESTSIVTDPNVMVPIDEVPDVQLALCAGEAAEKLFFNKVGEKHTGDRKQFRELEERKRGYLEQPEVSYEGNVVSERPKVSKVDVDELECECLFNEVVERAKFHLDSPKWKRIIEAVVEELLMHEELSYSDFIELPTVKEFEAKGHDDESVA